MADHRGCYYDCLHPPENLYPYPDISGVGVLIGYTATAGMVVLILVSHYYLVHDPTKDPFRENGDSSASALHNQQSDPVDSHPPNPIDLVYLRFSSKILGWMISKSNLPRAKTYPRLEAAFIKCVQLMSDLQILTGISILISGYVQLRCGISAFHWQILVLLAWFSSITHLSCLTFLRNYLYNRPAERMWRLVAMGIMLLMLLVAIVPTGGYNWTALDPTLPAPSDFAICYFRPATNSNDGGLTFATMVVSVVLLALGYVYRVIRLHKTLSVSVLGGARKFCSEKARYCLCKVQTKLGLDTSGMTLKRMFLYRPLVALFLTARALLDLWNSMFFEILWMVGSYSWGLIRLIQTLQLDDGSTSDWFFGQVVPIVLLATPLLTIFETFFQAEQSANTPSIALGHIHTAHSPLEVGSISSYSTFQERDNPGKQITTWTQPMTYLMVAYAIGTTTQILTFSSFGNTKLLTLLIPDGERYISYLPFSTVVTTWLFIIFSMLFEDIRCARANALSSVMGLTRKKFLLYSEILLFSITLPFGFITTNLLDDSRSLLYLGVMVAMYFTLSGTCCSVNRRVEIFT